MLYPFNPDEYHIAVNPSLIDDDSSIGVLLFKSEGEKCHPNRLVISAAPISPITVYHDPTLTPINLFHMEAEAAHFASSLVSLNPLATPFVPAKRKPTTLLSSCPYNPPINSVVTSNRYYKTRNLTELKFAVQNTNTFSTIKMKKLLTKHTSNLVKRTHSKPKNCIPTNNSILVNYNHQQISLSRSPTRSPYTTKCKRGSRRKDLKKYNSSLCITKTNKSIVNHKTLQAASLQPVSQTQCLPPFHETHLLVIKQNSPTHLHLTPICRKWNDAYISVLLIRNIPSRIIFSCNPTTSTNTVSSTELYDVFKPNKLKGTINHRTVTKDVVTSADQPAIQAKLKPKREAGLAPSSPPEGIG